MASQEAFILSGDRSAASQGEIKAFSTTASNIKTIDPVHTTSRTFN
jgi:hypothetical protein